MNDQCDCRWCCEKKRGIKAGEVIAVAVMIGVLIMLGLGLSALWSMVLK